MRYWVGITDSAWFELLRNKSPSEVNFWQPSATPLPSLLGPGIPFLFKLRAPINAVVGGGFFLRATSLPVRIAWEAFEEGNGVSSYSELRARIVELGGQRLPGDPVIACNILTDPFFFPEDEWIPIPADWHRNIQRGKTYDTEERHGASLWAAVRDRLAGSTAQVELGIRDEIRGTRLYLTQGRVGQGAFRCIVTDAYNRRCAVSGERTLPVLDAAHIRPYNKDGPNLASNGILLRKDIHKLFDYGYLTITDELMIKVSSRIREEFENGRDYYQHEGRNIRLPADSGDAPSKEFLRWHQDNVFEKWDSVALD